MAKFRFIFFAYIWVDLTTYCSLVFWISCWYFNNDHDPFNNTMFGIPIDQIYSWFHVNEPISLFHLLGCLSYFTQRSCITFSFSRHHYQNKECFENLSDEHKKYMEAKVSRVFSEVDTGVRIGGEVVTKIKKSVPDYITGPIALFVHPLANLMTVVMFWKLFVSVWDYFGYSMVPKDWF